MHLEPLEEKTEKATPPGEELHDLALDLHIARDVLAVLAANAALPLSVMSTLAGLVQTLDLVAPRLDQLGAELERRAPRVAASRPEPAPRAARKAPANRKPPKPPAAAAALRSNGTAKPAPGPADAPKPAPAP